VIGDDLLDFNAKSANEAASGAFGHQSTDLSADTRRQNQPSSQTAPAAKRAATGIMGSPWPV